jgi:hypothetical protein
MLGVFAIMSICCIYFGNILQLLHKYLRECIRIITCYLILARALDNFLADPKDVPATKNARRLNRRDWLSDLSDAFTGAGDWMGDNIFNPIAGGIEGIFDSASACRTAGELCNYLTPRCCGPGPNIVYGHHCTKTDTESIMESGRCEPDDPPPRGM